MSKPVVPESGRRSIYKSAREAHAAGDASLPVAAREAIHREAKARHRTEGKSGR